jgi:uncharacterized membrane protein
MPTSRELESDTFRPNASGSWLVWAIIVLISLSLVGLIVGAPLAQSTGHEAIGFTIYRAFSNLCHQLPERSFYLAGHQFAVCARCTGLYVGFAAASLIYPLARSLKRTDTPARRWLLLSAAPMAIDVGLDMLGIWKNTHLSRLSTGLLLGSVAAFYVIPGLIDLLNYDWRRLRLRRRGYAA